MSVKMAYQATKCGGFYFQAFVILHE
jgi:hypothetical protein